LKIKKKKLQKTWKITEKPGKSGKIREISEIDLENTWNFFFNNLEKPGKCPKKHLENVEKLRETQGKLREFFCQILVATLL
jgi:hypothetical protein